MTLSLGMVPTQYRRVPLRYPAEICGVAGSLPKPQAGRRACSFVTCVVNARIWTLRLFPPALPLEGDHVAVWASG